MIDYEYWELMTMNVMTAVKIINRWDDDRRLRYEQDQLRYNRFAYRFLTAENGQMARALGTEERHVEYLKSQIKWNEEAIANDHHYRKARAWAKKKEAKELAKSAEAGTPLGPEPITLGKDVKPEYILQIKYN